MGVGIAFNSMFSLEPNARSRRVLDCRRVLGSHNSYSPSVCQPVCRSLSLRVPLCLSISLSFSVLFALLLCMFVLLF